MSGFLPEEDRRWLDAESRELLRRSRQLTPPYDLFAMARSLGARVEFDWDDSAWAKLRFAGREHRLLELAGDDAAQGVTVLDGDTRVIRLRPNLPALQLPLVFAHEVAHVLLDHHSLLPLIGHRLVPLTGLEAQAIYTGHQLITGVDQLAQAVEALAAGHLPTIDHVHCAARVFKVRPYVGLRSYVEHSSRQAALISLIESGPDEIKVVTHVGRHWEGEIWPDPKHLSISRSASALPWRAHELIADPQHWEHLREVIWDVRKRCDVDHATSHVTRRSVHLLLHRTR